VARSAIGGSGLRSREHEFAVLARLILFSLGRVAGPTKLRHFIRRRNSIRSGCTDRVAMGKAGAVTDVTSDRFAGMLVRLPIGELIGVTRRAGFAHVLCGERPEQQGREKPH
jgi:hypothetical protein